MAYSYRPNTNHPEMRRAPKKWYTSKQAWTHVSNRGFNVEATEEGLVDSDTGLTLFWKSSNNNTAWILARDGNDIGVFPIKELAVSHCDAYIAAMTRPPDQCYGWLNGNNYRIGVWHNKAGQNPIDDVTYFTVRQVMVSTLTSESPADFWHDLGY